MKYIDIHCHLDFSDYGSELPSVLGRMKEREVGAITIGTDLASSERAVAIAEQNENIWACIGVHPVDNEKGERVSFSENDFEKLISNPKVVAIGECGLDWFRIPAELLGQEKERQTEVFKQQIEFALKHNKPLMLHCRESYDDALEILTAYKKQVGEKLRGNAHFFAGNMDQARKFLDLGFSMSFTGVVTFTHDYDEVIKYLPIDSIMSETDAPFVAPVPYRGKRNEPSYVVEVAKKIAEIRGEREDVVCAQVLRNAQKMFGLSF